MPDDPLEINIPFLLRFSCIFVNLKYSMGLNMTRDIGGANDLTIGSHPTSLPPPTPLPFRKFAGRLAQRAITGYPLAVPKVDRRVLSAYSIIPNGKAPGGSLLYYDDVNERLLMSEL